MDPESLILLAVRLGLVLVLYLFLGRVVAALWRDLRRGSAGPARGGEQGPVLRVLEPGQAAFDRGQVLPLYGETTMGREPANAVVIHDDAVSGRHAALSPNGRHWLLRDVGSTNGTFLNKRPITAAVQLKSGDVIQIGRVSLRFEEGRPSRVEAGSR